MVEKNNINLGCLLYTSDAADEQRGVELGGYRTLKKKKKTYIKKNEDTTKNKTQRT